jgi:hypothetical protein
MFITLLLLAGCAKRNFFPDEDDPGLSLLTSNGFNIASSYINEVPYINPYHKTIFGINNYLPALRKIITNSAFDTLSLSWQIEPNDSSLIYNAKYQSITLLIPVPKIFTQNDFLLLNGQRFSSNTNKINIQSNYYLFNQLSGTSNIYFVEIKKDNSVDPKNYIISGLFDGNIGDSILITKGRFDFEIGAGSLNF